MKTLEEYLALYRMLHAEKYNLQIDDDGVMKTIPKGITPGELLGFKHAYEMIKKDIEQDISTKL